MRSPGDLRAGGAYVEATLDDAKLTRGLTMVKRRLSAFASSVGAIGRQLTMAGTAMMAPLVFSGRVFASYETNMLYIRGITNMAQRDFNLLNEEVKRLGRTTVFTTTQVSEAAVILTKAGFTPQETFKSLSQILDFALANMVEMGQAADVAAGTLRAYHMEASEMGRITDVVTAGVNNSAATFYDYSESLKYCLPIAKQYEMTLEDLVIAIGTMGNVSIKGSMAGTSLRNMLIELTDKSKGLRLQQEFGIHVVDSSTGKMRRFNDVMKEIGRAMDRMTEAQKIQLAGALFWKRAVPGALTIATTSFQRLNDKVNNAGSTSARMAGMVQSGWEGASKRIKSAFEAMQLAFADAFTKPLGLIYRALADLEDKIAKWIGKNKELVIYYATTAGSVFALGTAFLGLYVALKWVGIAFQMVLLPFQLFQSIIILCLAPLSWLFAALTLLATPLGYITLMLGLGIAVWGKYTEAGERSVKKIVDGFARESKSITALFGTLSDVVGRTFKGITDAFKGKDMVLAFEIGITGIKIVWLEMLQYLLKAFNSEFINRIKFVWNYLVKGLEAGVHAITYEVEWAELQREKKSKLKEFREMFPPRSDIQQKLREENERYHRERIAFHKEMRGKGFLGLYWETAEDEMRLKDLEERHRRRRSIIEGTWGIEQEYLKKQKDLLDKYINIGKTMEERFRKSLLPSKGLTDELERLNEALSKARSEFGKLNAEAAKIAENAALWERFGETWKRLLSSTPGKGFLQVIDALNEFAKRPPFPFFASIKQFGIDRALKSQFEQFKAKPFEMGFKLVMPRTAIALGLTGPIKTIVDSLMTEQKKVPEGVAEAIETATAGTFSPWVLDRLGGRDFAKQTAENTKGIADDVKEIKDDVGNLKMEIGV